MPTGKQLPMFYSSLFAPSSVS